MDKNGKGFKIFATGIRNTVGFDWRPGTRELWFTDNGRDMLGEDIPSDELNVAKKAGENFGYPYCHEGTILDPEFGKNKNCKNYRPPELRLGAHVAALGMRFYRGGMFPAKFKDQIFIAEHGSWNRKVPVGYRVMLVHVDKKGRVTGSELFADGWLENGEAWGRPVDVSVAPDGALMISDDKAGVIYRVSYKKP
jgi:glucose/arabinose dehydrogenase